MHQETISKHTEHDVSDKQDLKDEKVHEEDAYKSLQTDTHYEKRSSHLTKRVTTNALKQQKLKCEQ